MKLPGTIKNAGGRAKKRASVLIIVLWLSIGLVTIALYFANSMNYELQAADNRVSGIAADQAIEGAARYVELSTAKLHDQWHDHAAGQHAISV